MPTPGQKTQKKRFHRTPGGRVKTSYKRKHPGKHHCAVDGSVLHGVPHHRKNHEVHKLAKSGRRPTALFGGILSGNTRRRVMEEAVKVKYFGKKITDVDLRMKQYVETAFRRLGE